VQGDGARIAKVAANIRREFLALGLRRSERSEISRASDLRHALHVSRPLARLGFPRTFTGERPSEDDLQDLFDYLRDARVYENACVHVEVPCDDDEVAFLEAAQRYVRRELARREVTVETNPSSNLVVGDLARIEDHPALNLCPVHEQGDGRVAVSLNDDDPLTFATRLADEYAYLYAALLRANTASDLALRWLDEARRAAWRSRFTLPLSGELAVLDGWLEGERGT
jgi:hypothetical protein